MTIEQVQEWHTLRLQLKNGYHLSKYDIDHLVHLNHLLMEETHEIHNNRMLKVI